MSPVHCPLLDVQSRHLGEVIDLIIARYASGEEPHPSSVRHILAGVQASLGQTFDRARRNVQPAPVQARIARQPENLRGVRRRSRSAVARRHPASFSGCVLNSQQDRRRLTTQ